MNQDQINAAMAEMNATIQSLLQRNVNLAVELVTVKADLTAARAELDAGKPKAAGEA